MRVYRDVCWSWLQADELQRLCSSLGASLTPIQAEAAMRLLDRDNNGTVDKREFVDWWLSRGQDLDGDGRVSELEGRLNKVALSGSNEAVRVYIEKIRSDRDSLNRWGCCWRLCGGFCCQAAFG